jgi:hypothetical protein
MNTGALSRDLLRRTALLVLYASFAIGVYISNGPTPPISIDHIAYFKLADGIRAAYPAHDYWRAIGVTRTYGVIMAYAYGLTGDNIQTLRILLAAMTVAYLWCTELLFSLFTSKKWSAVLFALLSAFHVSFGSVFWGVTDFEASLNRTLAIPPMLLLLYWYLANYDRARRYAAYPALVLLSVLHLGTYYLLSVLFAMDAIRIALELSHGRPPLKLLGPFAGALVLVAGAYLVIRPLSLDRSILSRLVPRFERAPVGEAPAMAVDTQTTPLGSKEAWEVELFAQPWRNFPVPLATLLAAVMSLALIIPLSFLGGLWAIRHTRWRRFDRPMLLMTLCVLICAYSLQFSLWVARHWFPVYPLNFEEVRTISLIYLPILYFALRAFDFLWYDNGSVNARRLACLGLCLMLLQPIVVVRLLPRAVREELFQTAIRMGILDGRESQRNMYARQVLKLESAGDRFYYSMLPALAWLRAHTTAESRILTNRDEVYLLPATVVGTSNGFLSTDSSSPGRALWRRQVLEMDSAAASHDAVRIREIARKYGADFAILPWPEEGAVFSDGNLSILRIE